MNRQEKEVVVQQLHDDFKKTNASFLVGIKGLTVSQTQTLRRELRTQGGQLRVAKVRLMKRAIDQAEDVSVLTPFLKEQIGVVFAMEEAPSVAKVLFDFAKANKSLELVAGCLESNLMDKAAIGRIATLPSREVLLAQLLGSMQAPISGLVRTLHMLPLKLVLVLKQIEEQKKQQS
jgi:large subunit ribosomal protein L10